MEIKIKSMSELSTGELYQILKLRQDIFVVEQQCIYSDLDQRDDASWHLCVWEGEILAGYLRILKKGQTFDTVAIGRVAVHSDFRKNQIARTMLKQALSFIRESLHEKTVKLAAQQYLTDFYMSLGFQTISQVYLEDGIPHVDMELVF